MDIVGNSSFQTTLYASEIGQKQAEKRISQAFRNSFQNSYSSTDWLQHSTEPSNSRLTMQRVVVEVCQAMVVVVVLWFLNPGTV